MSSIYWAQDGFGAPEEYFTNQVNCRKAVGTRLFERPQPTYIPRASWFAYAGCRPVFSPGVPNEWEDLYVGGPDGGRHALETLHKAFLKGGNDSRRLAVACPINSNDDPVCVHARAKHACTHGGTAFENCTLTREDREQLLRNAAW